MQRNHGIDFLRIISMLMVVVLHILGKGGILEATTPNSLHYWVAWLLEISCYCAVDCFALISGYVMWHSKLKISKAVGLWLQTFFYTALTLLLFSIFKPEIVSRSSIIDALFFITRNHYWYISTYFGLLVLSPLLNAAIDNTDQKVLSAVLLTVLVLFSTLPHILLRDPYAFKVGYSLMWLSLLYLAGGYLSKYSIPDKIKKSHAWFTIGAMITLTFLSKFILENFPQHILPVNGLGNAFIAYTSPNIVLIAISLVILCSKHSFGALGIKLIRILAPASLGVYLIHKNEFIRENIITDLFTHYVDFNCIVMVFMVLLSALGIYAVCTTIELIRIRLFKFAKIDKLCKAVEVHLINLFNTYVKL